MKLHHPDDQNDGGATYSNFAVFHHAAKHAKDFLFASMHSQLKQCPEGVGQLIAVQRLIADMCKQMIVSRPAPAHLLQPINAVLAVKLSKKGFEFLRAGLRHVSSLIAGWGADVRDETAPAGGMLYNIERRSAGGAK